VKVPHPSVPFPRSYWVIPDRFLAGSYPGSVNPEEAKAKMSALIHSGIRNIINLMEQDEVNEYGEPFSPYDGMFLEMGRNMGLSLAFQRFPIRDMDVPTPGEMNRILNEIGASLSADRPVYVHCWGGKGRTGVVVGCYLVRQGLSGHEALEKIKDLRRYEAQGNLPSPQTTSQREMVVSWKKLDQKA